MKLRYTYRLRPGAVAVARLNKEAAMTRWVWNKCVERAKARDPWWTDKDLTAARNDPETAWLGEGSAVVQQQVIRDFRTSKHRKKFKSVKTAKISLNYTKRGFSISEIDGKLRLKLAGGLVIPVVWSREMPSEPSSVRVYQDSLGHWYASFVVEREDEKLPANTKAIGIDWGVRDIATTTDADYNLPHSQFGRKAAAQLAAAQKRMARRRPANFQPSSKGYLEAKKQAAKVHQKVVNQRQDAARKWAKRVVNNHGFIAIEDFQPKFLAKSRMARKSSDGAIGATKRELISMSERAGRTVVMVPPAYTTMTCSNCTARAKQKLSLSVRIFACESCGFAEDRDVNAARNILATAGFNGASVDAVRLDQDRRVEVELAELGIPRL